MPHFQTQELPVTQVGQKMQEQMDSLGLDIKAVADKLGSTYEYVRRMVRGLSIPSKYMVRNVAQILNIDEKEMEEMMVADNIRLKHGEAGLRVQGKNPELEPFERGWHLLNKQQKEIILTQYKTFVAQQRKHAKARKAN
jgi:transcriptional regulator with XRE-family HTH domain